MADHKVAAYNEKSHTGVVRHIYLRRGGVSGAVLLCVLYVYVTRRKTRTKESAHKADLILSRYGVENCEALSALSYRYAETLRSYDAECAKAEAKKQALQKSVEDAAAQMDALIAKTARFASGCRSAAAAQAEASSASPA